MDDEIVYSLWRHKVYRFDGDLVFLTDNPVLVRRHKVLPTLMCGQKSSPKIIPTEKDLVEANIASFGNDVGTVTNYITSMYDVRSRFEPGSPEYEMLQYRIKCGQQKQQDAIDKAKGIVSKPMEKSWYDIHAALDIDDDEKRALYLSICANKKPYFMRYIYPSLMREYNKFMSSTNKKFYRDYGMTFEEMRNMRYGDLTDAQRSALHFYEEMMPVGCGDCVMNKICRLIENEFDSVAHRRSALEDFDYSIMKSNVEYTSTMRSNIVKLIKEYNANIKCHTARTKVERVDADSQRCALYNIRECFSRDCHVVCPEHGMLCDIILDYCYSKSCAKALTWLVCGDEIVDNLLKKSGYVIRYPMRSDDGDIEYRGEKFEECELNIGG